MMHGMRRFVIAAALLWAAGCSSGAVPVEQCGGNAQLVNGVCRPLCTNGGGCLVGESCVEGVCLPGVPGEDASMPADDAEVADQGVVEADGGEEKDAEVSEDARDGVDASPDAGRDAGARDADEPLRDGEVRRQPDLHVRETSQLMGTLLVDDAFPLAVTVENIGDRVSSATQVALFVNARGINERRPESIRVGLAAVNPVQSGSSVVTTINARLPTSMPPGERTLIVVVDPEDTLAEVDETNNTFLVGDVEVTTITTDRATIDFGRVVAPCGEGVQSLAIVNRSTVSSVDVTRIGLSSMSSVFQPRAPMTPLTLGPNSQISFANLFTPAVPGMAMGVLEIRHTQPGSPLIVPLAGTGFTGRVTDTFRPADLVRRADVVLVIDPELPTATRNDLAAQAPMILSDLGTRMIDYRVAVMQAGALTGSRGFIGTPAFITPNTPNGANELANRIASTSVIVPTPHVGFDEIDRALDASGPGLLANAWLEFIVVTDRDDTTGTSPATLVADLVAEKPAQGVVAVSGLVVPTAVACMGTSATSRYNDVIARLAGRSAAVCLRTWAPVLSGIGGPRFGMPFAYSLSRAPDQASIQVTVGGVPAMSFVYDSGANRVILSNETIPEPGQGVDISYTAVCP